MGAMRTCGLIALVLLICFSNNVDAQEVTEDPGSTTDIPDETTTDKIETTTEEPNSVTAHPCTNTNCNNGTCSKSESASSGYTCTCDEGCTGLHCDVCTNPCDTANCNYGTCQKDDNAESGYTCKCLSFCPGEHCETCATPQAGVYSNFVLTFTATTVSNQTATYQVAYANATSTLYKTLQGNVCQWLAQVAKLVLIQIIDCKLKSVTSGSLIIESEISVASDSSVSTSNLATTISDAADSDAGLLTIDNNSVNVVTGTGFLSCPTCYFYDYYRGNGLFYYSEGQSGCVSGAGISSVPCYWFPESGREHRCAAFDHIEDLVEGDVSVGRTRYFSRGCVSVAPSYPAELLGARAIDFIENDIDSEYDEYNITSTTNNTFVRLLFCDKDDCLTNYEACPDPRQVQCYNSSKCISLDQFCDQRQDCPEEEDENEELCGVPLPCSGPTDFKCTNDTDECIHISQVCDGINDCNNAIDESECDGVCERPSLPANGRIIDPIPFYQDGRSIVYACNDGYTLQNSNQTCDNGTFAGDSPQCIKNCGTPKVNDDNIEIGFNGTFDNGAKYPHEGNITLTCKTGYYLDPSDDVSQFTCQRGLWVKTGTNKINAFICKNTDECANDVDPCLSSNAMCVDTVGSYECVCRKGYKKNSDDNCIDIDECENDDPCAENANCNNTAGSYLCECIDGYEGDGNTECQRSLFFAYNEPNSNTRSLRSSPSYYLYRYKHEYASYSFWVPAGFPFGKKFFKYIYVTANGVVVLEERYSWLKSSFSYPESKFGASYYWETFVAPFWTKTDFRKGGNVYYQTFDLFRSYPSNTEEVLTDINTRISEANNADYAGFEATWAFIVTWENMPEISSAQNTDKTNTFQAVFATDGLRSFVFFIYKPGRMLWAALEQKNAIIGYTNPDNTIQPLNLQDELDDKYRPDEAAGNVMGQKGFWLYRLDTNDLDSVNPSQYCEEWASEQPELASSLNFVVRPCPCSVAQAIADSRYSECERISENLEGFNSPAEDEVTCYQQRWATWIRGPYSYCRWCWWCSQCRGGTWYTTGGRCSYDLSGALITGYKDVWANSNAKLYHGSLGGRLYWPSYATKLDWRDKEVLARYYCCKVSDKCSLYQEHRPPLTCDGYRQVQPGCFYGDPHIVTLDFHTYSFNGQGEYTMVKIDEDDLVYELQGRTDFAIVNGTKQDDGGTVFIAFAAKFGENIVEFILNDERDDFVTVINGTTIVDAEALKNGTSYIAETDSSLSIDYTQPTNTSNGRIAARWTTKKPGDNQTDVDFTVSAAVQLAVLDIVVEVPPEIRELNITRGLMGVYNGDSEDDFVFPNGSMLEPADGENLTDSEIFDYGETWRVTNLTSLFSYSDEAGGGDWETFNNESYVPPFLDELLENADADLKTRAYAVCGDNTECLFDALATKSTAIAASTASTDSAFKSLVASLDNFPPNITSIEETSSGDSLQDNDTRKVLQLEVGETYTYQITASDPNDDDIEYMLSTSGLGATITQAGVLTLTPTSTNETQLEVIASDGKANSSLSFRLKLCSCQNDGECEWSPDNEAEAEFTVVSCICTEGWTGDDCSEDLDSCEDNPCYPGVQCIDQPPPEVNATCGSCPSGLLGDGFSCYDFDECADDSTNGCDQTCTNNLGSYDCSCDEGYVLAIDKKGCDDIDECLESHDCSSNSTCNNTFGSYECPCNDGYEKIGDDCLDIDECLTYPCANVATCINYPGGHTCQCPDGYYGDGVECTDIDECLGADTNNCHQEATCTNQDGSYECTCNAGYEGTGVSCDDVNECTSGTAACHSRAQCENTVGSYLCKCESGFIGDGLTCTDINECDKGIDNCTQVCTNAEPGFMCSCQTGFTFTNNDCEASTVCTDTSITCGGDLGSCARISSTDTCSCVRGAQVDPTDAKVCLDVNECANDTDNDCDADHGSCVNASPGYTCSCESGYELDNDARTCRDINECATSTDECAAKASCSNTDGSYNCTCDTGYAGNGTVCTNINECEGSVCHANAKCTDTEGSYTCACKEGFQGDGYSDCIDLNECNTVGICDAQASCNNTQGSYSCTCNEGYFGDGKMCEDIDECTSFSSPHNCPANSRCINNVGSFACTCNSGYKGLTVDDALTCPDVDECSEGYDNCHANANCTDTDGAFTCACNTGYEGNGVTCTDIDECSISIPCSSQNKERCENRVGSHRCICQTNYYRQGSGLTCQASTSYSMVGFFSLVKGLDPSRLFSEVNTQANRDALSTDITNLFKASSNASVFLGASVIGIKDTAGGAEVTTRLDFTANEPVTSEEIEDEFLEGLDDNMYLGSDNRVVNVTVTSSVINPCDEGTHDCFDKNFADCIFVAHQQFRCENCKDGYRNGTNSEGAICTEIKPCTEEPDICTDKNFINCVPDGPGQYHCENCKDTYSQEGQMCVVYKTLQGSFSMSSVQGTTAQYTASLANSASDDFKNLAGIVCTQVTAAMSTNESTIYNCGVLKFEAGSIVATYAVVLDDTETTASQEDLQQALVAYLTTGPGAALLGVDNSSFIIKDICANLSCQNGGWCVPDENFNAVCKCAGSYIGTNCESLPTTAAIKASTEKTKTSDAKKGLSTGAIIGIAVGCSVLVLLIVIVIIVMIIKAKASAKVSAVENDNHHDEPGREEERENDVRDSPRVERE